MVMSKNTSQYNNIRDILFNDFEAFSCGTPTCNQPKVFPDQYEPLNMWQPEFPPFSNYMPDPSVMQTPLPATKNTKIRMLNPVAYAVENGSEDEAEKPNEDASNFKRPTVKLVEAPQKKKKAPIVKSETAPPALPETSNTKNVISVHIKPARKTRKSYVAFFPEKLYCTPYKYDVRLRLGVNLDDENYTNFLNTNGEQHLVFKLLDGDTRKQLKTNTKGEQALIVEKCKKQDEEEEEDDVQDHDDRREVAYRLCFTVCSFHNFRRPFVIQCSDKTSGMILFESNPFHIYARKNNKDKHGQAVNTDAWGDEIPASSIKILFNDNLPNQTSMEEDDEQQPLKQLNKRKREQSDDDESDQDDEEEVFTVHRAKRQKVAAQQMQQQDAFSELENMTRL